MRLIDVDTLKFTSGINEDGVLYVPYRDICGAPTVNAEPVRHGHWEHGSGFYPPICSVCNLVPLTPGYVGDVNFYKRYFKHCPNCGAKMDEEE